MSDTEWRSTQDGKGSWRLLGGYRLVVKMQDSIDEWWWGVYEGDCSDDLYEDGAERGEAAAQYAAENVVLVM